MAAVDYPGFEADPDVTIWRYMSVDRFASMLSDGLYFAAARQFGDPFEGAIPDAATRRRRSEALARFPDEPDMQDFLTNGVSGAFEDLRRLVKVNCWHASGHENVAMWERYVPGGESGIAVISTVQRLKAALQEYRLQPHYGEEKIVVGAVHYVSYETEELYDDAERARFFHKRIEYQDENEIRAVLSLRVPSEYNVPIPDDGTFVDVDLSELVREVRVGPGATSDEINRVKHLSLGVGGSWPVLTSTLDSRPDY